MGPVKKVIGLVFVMVMAFSIGYLVKDQIPTFAGVNPSANEVKTSTETEPVEEFVHTTVNDSPDSNDSEELLGEIADLEEQIDELLNQKIDLEAKIADITLELGESSEQLDTAQEEKQELTKQVNTLKDEIQRLETEILRNEETITFLDS